MSVDAKTNRNRLGALLTWAAAPFVYACARIFPSRLATDRRFFRTWESRGYHVTPNHFYQPIPDTRELSDALWATPSALPGIDVDEQGQIDLLAQFVAAFKAEYEALPRSKAAAPHLYYLNNASFESVDAEILYCMIRHFKPRRVWEIGSGFSTLLAAQAIEENRRLDGSRCELVAFEPYPNPTLKTGFPGLSRLVASRIQDVPLPEFAKLEQNDFLFIDSSHVLKIGSDVQYEYLEVLPRLAEGVIVHCHDIFLPAEYPRDWVVNDHRFWNEQYLLQAFLAFNRAFQVLWAGSFMHLRHPDKLEAAFSSYVRDRTKPGSFWMRKTE